MNIVSFSAWFLKETLDTLSRNVLGLPKPSIIIKTTPTQSISLWLSIKLKMFSFFNKNPSLPTLLEKILLIFPNKLISICNWKILSTITNLELVDCNLFQEWLHYSVQSTIKHIKHIFIYVLKIYLYIWATWAEEYTYSYLSRVFPEKPFNILYSVSNFSLK